ncbi:hypothetical protein [Nocardia vaccinii]|uniref:hypothetical protein n=1 Tax=Nocardia vaccinii TaxID=1822 RepID=UPI00083684F3|nr:hypothetical protein [Nocardia vaccinii]
MAKVTAPRNLSAAGRKLWTKITTDYDLRADELRVLEDACRESDLIDTLEAESRGAQLVVQGSTGQPVINPLISELRQHRSTLASLFRQLKLPDEGANPEARSASARAAANARWSRRGA